MPLTPLIGRISELEYLGRVLRVRATRLLVLTGPGGVGKTRLAISAAQSVADAFADGVTMINLATISTADQVLPAIADAVGVRGVVGETLYAAIVETLRTRDTLLLLDNFEQVIDAAPAVVSGGRLEVVGHGRSSSSRRARASSWRAASWSSAG